jgi:glycosyltransferase involved in cell wall biosynthesis
MNIAFYIHHSTTTAGGIFNYSKGILRLILESDQISSVVLISSPEVIKNLKEFEAHPKIKYCKIDQESILNKVRFGLAYFLFDICTIYRDHFKNSRSLNLVKRFSLLLNPYYSHLKSLKVSLIHIPVQYSPVYCDSVPVITTMHDLQEFHFPENFSSVERIHRAINNDKSITHSSQIIVSFQHIKNDIVKFYGVDERRISVCPPQFTVNWFFVKRETDWQELAKNYGIQKKYLLYPAVTWKHKNHIKLIEALKIIRDEGIEIELICTGNQTNHYMNILEKMKELNLSRAVYFLGIVPEEDLISLYKNSSLVVIPTLYEAGSGPLYEAMKYEIPVICSNVTSLPDTIGNSEFLFDPNNVSDLAEKIKIGLQDGDFRKRNIENSINRMEHFKKIDYSKNFVDVYKEIIDR